VKKQLSLGIFAFLGLLLMAGCGTAAPAGSAPTAVPRQPGAAAPAPTRVAQGSQPASNTNCAAQQAALMDLIAAQPSLIIFATGHASAVNRADSSFYIDTTKVRAALAVLATIPDPTDPQVLAMAGKVSDAIAQYRQLLTAIDQAAAGAPATDTAADQQAILSFGAKLTQMYEAVTMGLGAACPNQPNAVAGTGQAAGPPTPSPVGYQIGQTAPVGDLRVTLNRVVAPPGTAALAPSAGNRYLYAYFTVDNQGKTPFGVNTLSGVFFVNAAGTQFFGDPYAMAFDDTAVTNMTSEINPGEKRSGAVGFQIPRDAGDLLWVFQDYRPTQAVFAVKVADIVAAGPQVTEPTADAQRAQAAATQTAFVEFLVNGVATQEAAGTETPAPPEATDTPAPDVPTDTVVPDAPTDTMAPAVPADTAVPDAPTDTGLPSP